MIYVVGTRTYIFNKETQFIMLYYSFTRPQQIDRACFDSEAQ